MFDGIFTNILADGEVPGYVPDADGDWFYILRKIGRAHV